jgi:DNA-binding MarR family transcriptional regulator
MTTVSSGERVLTFHDSVMYQLRRAGQVTAAVWQRRMAELTPTQFGVLFALGGSERLDQTELGAIASVDRSTLTPLLDRLEARGLITKTVDQANRRRRLIELTEAGRACLAVGAVRVEETARWITSVLGEQRSRELAELLKALGDAPAHVG